MDNKFYLKKIVMNCVLASLVAIILSIWSFGTAYAFLIGAAAQIVPNLIFFALAWLSDINQTVVRGIAIRYFAVMFIKYLIVIALFSVSLGWLMLPLLPLLAGYFVSLLYQVMHSLITKQTAI